MFLDGFKFVDEMSKLNHFRQKMARKQKKKQKKSDRETNETAKKCISLTKYKLPANFSEVTLENSSSVFDSMSTENGGKLIFCYFLTLKNSTYTVVDQNSSTKAPKRRIKVVKSRRKLSSLRRMSTRRVAVEDKLSTHAIKDGHSVHLVAKNKCEVREFYLAFH